VGPVTFSIAAGDSDGVSFGVAVASKFLAVGSVVPAAAAGVGAIATQAFANMAYRQDGLALLRRGLSAAEATASLVGADDGRDLRQLGVVDRSGQAANYTGSRCHAWAGGRSGPGYAIQGNVLASQEVVTGMEAAWLGCTPDQPLPRRLLAALEAGDTAGGDRRGRQSAALLVVSPGGGYGGGSDVLVDLRIDDHPQPVRELGRLLDLHDLYFGRSDADQLVALDGDVLLEVGQLLAQVGYPAAGSGPDAVMAALADWAGVENLEERLQDQPLLDPVVLGVLRTKATTYSSPSPSCPSPS
jgi:uncharacterized Ntn-hydrolase superfamily protein